MRGRICVFLRLRPNGGVSSRICAGCLRDVVSSTRHVNTERCTESVLHSIYSSLDIPLLHFLGGRLISEDFAFQYGLKPLKMRTIVVRTRLIPGNQRLEETS